MLAVPKGDWSPESKNGLVVALLWEPEEAAPVDETFEKVQFWKLVRHKYQPRFRP